MQLRTMIDLLATGTSEGAEKAWDTRGRGRKAVPSQNKRFKGDGPHLKQTPASTFWVKELNRYLSQKEYVQYKKDNPDPAPPAVNKRQVSAPKMKIPALPPGDKRLTALHTLHDAVVDHPARDVEAPSQSQVDNYYKQLEDLYTRTSKFAGGKFSKELGNARNELDNVYKDTADQLGDPAARGGTHADQALDIMHGVLRQMGDGRWLGPGASFYHNHDVDNALDNLPGQAKAGGQDNPEKARKYLKDMQWHLPASQFKQFVDDYLPDSYKSYFAKNPL